MSGAINNCERDLRKCSSASLLTSIWLGGLLTGTVLTFLSLEHMSVLSAFICQSFFTMPRKFLTGILPFLLSAIAVYFSRPGWVYCICGIKAVLFAACSVLICNYYGQAGWLACGLFMFFDIYSLPLLFFYWLWILSDRRDRNIRVSMIFLIPILVLIFLDYRIVDPYASKFGLFEGKGILFHVGSYLCL